MDGFHKEVAMFNILIYIFSIRKKKASAKNRKRRFCVKPCYLTLYFIMLKNGRYRHMNTKRFEARNVKPHYIYIYSFNRQ